MTILVYIRGAPINNRIDFFLNILCEYQLLKSNTVSKLQVTSINCKNFIIVGRTRHKICRIKEPVKI